MCLIPQKMKRILLIYLILTSFLSGYSQTAGGKGKFFSGVDVGYVQIYNNMLLPYEFSGSNYGINLEWQIFNSPKWLSRAYFSIDYTSSFVRDMAIDIPIFNTNQHSLRARLQYNLLRQLYSVPTSRFRLFAGGGIDICPEASLFLHRDIQKYFLRADFGLDCSLFAEYDFGKVRVSDGFTMPVVVGSFYPHYNTVPFYSVGGAQNYFLFVSIDKIIRLNNILKFEIPVKITENIRPTIWLSYAFGYEYSSIRDNTIRLMTHSGQAGFVFNICN